MAAAPVALSDCGDVDGARRRPQAHLARVRAPVGLVADHRGHLGALERPHVVDDALGQRLVRAGLVVVLGRDVGDGEAALVEPLDALDRPRDEVELLDWDALVQAPVDVVDVDPGLDQLGRHAVGVRARVLVHEAARVGHNRDVEGRRDVGRDLSAQEPREPVEDLGGARGARVDEV
jgi:hypothetical protein